MESSDKSDGAKANELFQKIRNDLEKTKKNINQMVNLLESDEWGARSSAAFALGLIAEESPGEVEPYIDEIGELLKDDDFPVRENAARTLGKIGEESPEKMERYVAALEVLSQNDSNEFVRKAAEDALSRLS